MSAQAQRGSGEPTRPIACQCGDTKATTDSATLARENQARQAHHDSVPVQSDIQALIEHTQHTPGKLIPCSRTKCAAVGPELMAWEGNPDAVALQLPLPVPVPLSHT